MIVWIIYSLSRIGGHSPPLPYSELVKLKTVFLPGYVSPYLINILTPPPNIDYILFFITAIFIGGLILGSIGYLFDRRKSRGGETQ